MPKTLTLEEARQRTEARGFRFLSPAYEGNHQKHLFACSKGHKWQAPPSRVWAGHGCPTCSNERKADAKRLTLVEAIAKTEAMGFRFLSPAYKNSQSKHLFGCAQGHEWEAKPNGIWQGYGCPICSNETRGDASRLSLEEAKSKTEARGFRFLSSAYLDSKAKHLFGCPQGHEWEAKPNGVWGGRGCPHCSGKAHLTLDEAKVRTEARGFRWISESYDGAKKKHLFACSKGHKWQAPPSRVWAGHGCPHCAGNGLLMLDEAKVRTEARGFRWLSEAYEGDAKKHRFGCLEGHEWEAKPNSVWQGSGCPICAPLKSERIVREILAEDFGIATEKARPAWLRHRKGRTLELDGLQRDFGFAWEHQGDQHFRFDPFFHRGDEKRFQSQQERDAFKREATALQGVFLLEIPQAKPATREKIKETIERESERLCLPFASNPQFREMMAQAGL